MRDRVDWNTGKNMIDIEISHCTDKKKASCKSVGNPVEVRPKDVETGNMFDIFNEFWKEEGSPLMVKKDQLADSFMNTKVKNILDDAWE